MTGWVVALVLATAVLHAGWNAVLRHGADRLWTSALLALGDGAAAALGLLLVPLPSAASLPFIVASFFIHTAYRLLLAAAYRWGELGAVYPSARGSAPLLVTSGAALFAGEHLSPPALAAIAVISLGIIGLAQHGLGGAMPRHTLAVALATGVTIASYSVMDGIGSRLSGNSFSYVFWLEASEALPWPFILLLARGTLRSGRAARGDGWRALLGGAVSMIGYSLVVWAMTLAPLGIVSALRETSVVFAALIGWLFLGERLSWRRVGACGVIAAGIMALALTR
ncbi:MAG TPA: EamA family transporter [Stellaceae bacterium]